MLCAFIDESLSLSPEGDYFVAVAAVITDERRRLELMVRRLKRLPKLKAHSELKASVTPPQMIMKFLSSLANNSALEIVASVWHGHRSLVGSYEALYQEVVGRCALPVVRRHPRIDLIIDKRYTHIDQQRELEEAIRESIAVVPHNIVRVFQEDSRVVPELTAPDFVAWAVMQRYARGEYQFYNLIRSKVVHFDELRRQK